MFAFVQHSKMRRPLREGPCVRLSCESLEDRTLPSTFTVLNLADSGHGSLRQAVADANALAGPDVVQFAPNLQGTIALTSGELSITDDLTIAGPGESKLTISGSNGSRIFHIRGSDAEVAIRDLTIANGRATGKGVV
ncbi:MAG: hypothetical protein L0211_10370, partial [Planctomycetaceae bacterium]|nr:hypothetical protein [Planctomycetaceae bacterium]